MEEKMKILLKDYRVIIALSVIVLSIIFIRPSLATTKEGTFTLHTHLKMGIDLQGGITATIKPEIPTYENAKKVSDILLSRISTFGLKEARSSIVKINDEYYMQLSLAGANETDLKNLLEKQGVFKAYIERKAKKIEKDKYSFKLKGKSFVVYGGENNTLKYNNKTIHPNETFEIEGFTIKYVNRTDDEAILWIEAFSGQDIKSVLSGAQYSSVVNAGGVYSYYFTVTISQKAANNMKYLTQDMIPIGNSLNEKIVFVLDNEVVDRLNIDSGLKGVVATNVRITGTGETKEDAIKNMKRLIAILQSGSLPVGVKIVEMQEISPTLGSNFLRLSLYAIIFALIFVSLVVFLVYRDARIVIPMILTSLTEVLSILGFAALVSWTIDLAAIAGIVAAIGTGIDDQIVIIDETKKKREKESLRLKLKRAFFIIFSSAATTIGAMLPLLMSSFANVKGFAFTTIVGVLIGVFVTRPAFARTVKVLLE